jgi:hypothetical protein
VVRFRSQSAYGAASKVVAVLFVVALTAAAHGRQASIRPQIPSIPTPGAVHPVSGQPASPPNAAQAVKSASTTTAGEDQADLEGNDYVGNARTGIMTAKQFTYTEQDRVVTGDSAKYFSKTKELDADGNLVMDDPKHHITATHCHVDQKKKLSVITGSVVIQLKPGKTQPASNANPTPAASGDNRAATGKDGAAGSHSTTSTAGPDGAGDNPDNKEESDDVGKERSHGVTIYCDHADDYYKKDFIVLTGHLVFKQKIKKDDGSTLERTLTAEHAEYDGSKDQMVLFIPVEGHDSDGATLHFEKNAIVGTKEGEETLSSDGKVKVHFPIDEVKDKDTEPAKGPKKGDGKTSAPNKGT